MAWRKIAALVVTGTGLGCSELSCASPTAPPPLGEALVIVDTDMPVPAFVSRFRVDVYTEDGKTWYGSRDTSHARASDWPTSFGLVAPDNLTERVSLVRLRAYAEGKVRDYRGERYQARPPGGAPLDLVPPPAPTDGPRLLDSGGADITPATEPEPLLAIDRLLLVRVKPTVRGAVRVLLHGACVGTMADLAGRSSCIDTEATLAPSSLASLDPDMSLPSTSQIGTFSPPTPCTATPRSRGTEQDGTPLYDEEACVPGGMFVFGVEGAGGPLLSDAPERVAIVPPLRVDKYEVTVGRWRDALLHGFYTTHMPYANDGPLATSPPADQGLLCPYSSVPMGREDYALSCVSWFGARAFCQWLGGDLPTESQWEYASAVAMRPFPTRYPWGGDDGQVPTCSRVVVERGGTVTLDNECNLDGKSFGPLPAHALDGPGGDVAVGSGIVNFGGGLSEWAQDAAAPFSANCWLSASLESPACLFPSATNFSLRGGAWFSTWPTVARGFRDQFDSGILLRSPDIGFRCVRSGSMP